MGRLARLVHDDLCDEREVTRDGFCVACGELLQEPDPNYQVSVPEYVPSAPDEPHPHGVVDEVYVELAPDDLDEPDDGDLERSFDWYVWRGYRPNKRPGRWVR